MSPDPAPIKGPDMSVDFPRELSAGTEGELVVSLAPVCPATEILLEFDAKSVWVCGEGRIPGSPVFRLKPGSDGPYRFKFGTIAENKLTTLISVFARDASGAVIATRDCVIRYDKPAEPPGHLGEILNTLKWIHQRLNITMALVVVGAILVGSGWVYLKFAAMKPEDQENTLMWLRLASPRYLGEWEEPFRSDPLGKLWENRGDWNGPAQQWPSALQQSSNGPAKQVLAINTKEWGMPKPEIFNEAALYDFTFHLEGRLPETYRYSWVLRAQSGSARGYVFTLSRTNKFMHLAGMVKTRFGEAPLIPVHGVSFAVDCCQKGDYFEIDMKAEKYAFQVVQFALHNDAISNGRHFLNNPLNNDPEHMNLGEFRDGYESYRYGSVALFADDPNNPPQVNWLAVRNAH
jgi:hypothetical protein